MIETTEENTLSLFETILLLPFEERANKMMEYFVASQVTPGEEAIHDLRVSIRRCLAIADILISFVPAIALLKVQSKIKPVLSGLNELRDLQVMGEFLAKEEAHFPLAHPFRLFIGAATEKELKKVEKALAKTSSPLVSNKRMSKIRKKVLPFTESQTSIELLAPIDAAFQRCLKRSAVINEAEPATIHSLRIAFKRFRYGIEVVFPIVAGFTPELLKKMQPYQTLMGEIQDAEVVRNAYQKFMRQHPGEGEQVTLDYLGLLLQKRIELFISRSEELHSFWRKSNTEPQPWEL